VRAVLYFVEQNSRAPVAGNKIVLVDNVQTVADHVRLEFLDHLFIAERRLELDNPCDGLEQGVRTQCHGQHDLLFAGPCVVEKRVLILQADISGQITAAARGNVVGVKPELQDESSSGCIDENMGAVALQADAFASRLFPRIRHANLEIGDGREWSVRRGIS
jgi:hypothetical protein